MDLRTSDEVANLLKVAPKTLANWRSSGDGPPHFKYGGLIRYPQKELDEWIKNRMSNRRY